MKRVQTRIYRALLLFILLLCIAALGYWSPVQPPEPMKGRWLKLDKQGQPMPPWSGPWACVYDQQTGLLWENKLDDESIHDGYWTYSWFLEENPGAGNGVENMGDCYFEKNRCDTQDLIRRANQEATCGRTNWRLPDVAELAGLIVTDPRPGEPTIASDFFPQTHHGDYWTRDSATELKRPFKHLSPGAMAINFGSGDIYGLPHRNAAFVRLVSD